MSTRRHIERSTKIIDSVIKGLFALGAFDMKIPTTDHPRPL